MRGARGGQASGIATLILVTHTVSRPPLHLQRAFPGHQSARECVCARGRLGRLAAVHLEAQQSQGGRLASCIMMMVSAAPESRGTCGASCSIAEVTLPLGVSHGGGHGRAPGDEPQRRTVMRRGTRRAETRRARACRARHAPSASTPAPALTLAWRGVVEGAVCSGVAGRWRRQGRSGPQTAGRTARLVDRNREMRMMVDAAAERLGRQAREKVAGLYHGASQLPATRGFNVHAHVNNVARSRPLQLWSSPRASASSTGCGLRKHGGCGLPLGLGAVVLGKDVLVVHVSVPAHAIHPQILSPQRASPSQHKLGHTSLVKALLEPAQAASLMLERQRFTCGGRGLLTVQRRCASDHSRGPSLLGVVSG